MALRWMIGIASMACCVLAADPPTPANVVLPWGPADCFVTKTFEDSEVFFEKNVEYGRADSPYHFGKKHEKLTMNVAFPSAKDTRKLRPVLVWIHGGAFLFGKADVDSYENKDMIMTMTTRGYVVVSINYRLVPTVDFHALSSVQPPEVAQEDARAAVRFVRKMASEWRIDTSRIAVGGDSAGAMAALAYAYVKQFSDGHSGNAEYDSSVNSVIALSGSLEDLVVCPIIGKAPDYKPSGCVFNSMDKGGNLTGELSAGDIPGVMLHGTADNVIPYASALSLKARAEEVGVDLELLTIPGVNHIPFGHIFNEDEPYFLQWLTHVSGSLNLAEAECPSANEVVV